MWRRVYVLLATGLAALPLLYVLPQKEPAYEGKSLSDWVVAMHQGKRPQREHAKAVVHQLGPQSLPVLLQWLQQPDRPSSLKYRVSRAKLAVVGWLERSKLLPPQSQSVTPDWKQSYRFLAVEAFSELGPEAKGAIPGLIQLLGARDRATNEVSDTATFAYIVLRKLAPDSTPALIGAVSSPDDQVWTLAAEALGEIGPEAHAAIPALRRRLQERDPSLRIEAAEALGKLGDSPQDFMPVVVASLRESGLADLDEKLGVLLEFKDHAQGAVPVLRDLLASVPASGDVTNLTLRCQLTNALAELSSKARPSQAQ